MKYGKVDSSKELLDFHAKLQDLETNRKKMGLPTIAEDIQRRAVNAEELVARKLAKAVRR